MSNMNFGNNYRSYSPNDNNFNNSWEPKCAENSNRNTDYFGEDKNSNFNCGFNNNQSYQSNHEPPNSNKFSNSPASFVPKQSFNSNFGNSPAPFVAKQSGNYGNNFNSSGSFAPKQNANYRNNNFTRNQSNFNKQNNNNNKRTFSQNSTFQNQGYTNNNGNNKQSGNYSSIKTFRQFYSNRQNEQNNSSQLENTAAPTLFMGRDISYPDDLNNLMNPFFCGVCNARLNSIKSANIHYESKAHDKHITSWLKKTFSEKGLDAPKVQRFVTEQPNEVPGPFRCDLCKLDLTSAQHALQHFNGKRHRQSAIKISPITGIGYFNVEGKWVETGKVIDKVTGKETSYILVNTPSGFEPVVLQTAPPPKTPIQLQSSQAENSGEPPAKKANLGVTETTISSNDKEKNLLKKKQEEQYRTMITEYEKKNTKVADSTTSNQYKTITLVTNDSTQKLQTPQEALDTQECKICSISTTSHDQMLLHLKGIRHTKKLKALGEPPILLASQKSQTTILDSLENNDPTDISMYRTPTGSYYCKICNAAFEDVAVIKRHIMSKTHLAATKQQDQPHPS